MDLVATISDLTPISTLTGAMAGMIHSSTLTDLVMAMDMAGAMVRAGDGDHPTVFTTLGIHGTDGIDGDTTTALTALPMDIVLLITGEAMAGEMEVLLVNQLPEQEDELTSDLLLTDSTFLAAEEPQVAAESATSLLLLQELLQTTVRR